MNSNLTSNPTSTLPSTAPLRQRIDWVTTLFLIGTPIAAIVLTPIQIYFEGLPPRFIIALFISFFLTSVSVTAGYHRLMAHRSHEAKDWLRFFYLFIGAGAFQGPAIKWCSDHRRHHRNVDGQEDPYAITKGLFYAHIGWLFLKEDSKYHGVFEADLKKDPMVALQYKYYVPLAIFVGFALPTFIGWLMGSWFTGFVLLGVVRIVLSQHMTFFINSLCHAIGSRPYTDKNSARDNFILAIFTSGEGYHNFHHYFQSDYRNGVRWYQWDPTKWWIGFFSLFGGTYRLKRVPSSEILKARLMMDQKRLLQVGVPAEKLALIKDKIEQAQIRIRSLKEDYSRMKLNMQESSRKKLVTLRTEIRIAKLEFRMALAQWSIYLRAFGKARGLA